VACATNRAHSPARSQQPAHICLYLQPLLSPPPTHPKAKELFIRDVNYIIKAGEIIIVDEFTGRTMAGRRWSDGLHQVGRDETLVDWH
jgi:hypothetical protein